MIFQGWEFAQSLIAHLLKSLRTNEQMWAIHSGRSGQMSNCEWIAQIAHDKWANVSNLLRPLRTNEQMSESLGFLTNCSFFSFAYKKWVIRSKKFGKNLFLVFFYSFFGSFCLKQKIRSFLLSEVSELLRSLRTNEQPWAIHSGCSEA